MTTTFERKLSAFIRNRAACLTCHRDLSWKRVATAGCRTPSHLHVSCRLHVLCVRAILRELTATDMLPVLWFGRTAVSYIDRLIFRGLVSVWLKRRRLYGHIIPFLPNVYPTMFVHTNSKFCLQPGCPKGAGIAQWFSAGLRAGWSVVRIPAETGNLPLHHCIQTGSGAHPASYPMGTGGSFPGGKAAGAWGWPLTSI
jgi:hypothetical protein